MPTVFIGIGSNLGDRQKHFAFAKEELLKKVKRAAFRCSPVYETEPVEAAGGKYLNAVWSFETELKPEKTLAMLRAIEAKAGRVRKKKNEPRPLDLDILFYDDRTIQDESLIVPHPRIAERAFVLVPFCDLAPEWKHPVLRKTMGQLLEQLKRTESGIHGVVTVEEKR